MEVGVLRGPIGSLRDLQLRPQLGLFLPEPNAVADRHGCLREGAVDGNGPGDGGTPRQKLLRGARVVMARGDDERTAHVSSATREAIVATSGVALRRRAAR